MRNKLLFLTIIFLLITGLISGIIVVKMQKPKTAAPQLPKNSSPLKKAQILFAPGKIDISANLNKPTSVKLVLLPNKNPIDSITVKVGYNPQVVSNVKIKPIVNPVINSQLKLTENTVNTKQGTLTLSYTAATNSALLKTGFPLAEISFIPVKNPGEKQVFYFLPGTEIQAPKSDAFEIQSVENNSVLGEVKPLLNK